MFKRLDAHFPSPYGMQSKIVAREHLDVGAVRSRRTVLGGTMGPKSAHGGRDGCLNRIHEVEVCTGSVGWREPGGYPW